MNAKPFILSALLSVPLASGLANGEPYVEWGEVGVPGDSMSMEVMAKMGDQRMPQKAEVRVPPFPKSVLVGTSPASGPRGMCGLDLRTDAPKSKVCDFYKKHYPIEQGFLTKYGENGRCRFVKSSDPDGESLYVMPAPVGGRFALNGGTQIMMSYTPATGRKCRD